MGAPPPPPKAITAPQYNTKIKFVSVFSHFLLFLTNYFLFIAEKVVQVSISSISNTFEVYLDSKEEKSSQDVVLSGKLLEADSIVLPADIQEYNPGMEEVTEQEVYSSLSHFGLYLGPEFQCIKRIFIGESGISIAFLMYIVTYY